MCVVSHSPAPGMATCQTWACVEGVHSLHLCQPAVGRQAAGGRIQHCVQAMPAAMPIAHAMLMSSMLASPSCCAAASTHAALLCTMRSCITPRCIFSCTAGLPTPVHGPRPATLAPSLLLCAAATGCWTPGAAGECCTTFQRPATWSRSSFPRVSCGLDIDPTQLLTSFRQRMSQRF